MRLLVIFGPPAVGKMAVGREIAARSTFRLFHNHASIEPLLDVFEYGTPPFVRLLDEFRTRVVEEAAAAGVDLVLTYAWPLDRDDELATMRRYLAPYLALDAEIAFVELYADLDTRLARNRTELRLAEKRSKRDLEWSHDNVRDMERFLLSTTPGARVRAHDLLDRHRHLRLDNTDLGVVETAERILSWLEHPRLP